MSNLQLHVSTPEHDPAVDALQVIHYGDLREREPLGPLVGDRTGTAPR